MREIALSTKQIRSKYVTTYLVRESLSVKLFNVGNFSERFHRYAFSNKRRKYDAIATKIWAILSCIDSEVWAENEWKNNCGATNFKKMSSVNFWIQL